MKKSYTVFLVALLALFCGACTSDSSSGDKKANEEGDASTGSAGKSGSGDAKYEACLKELHPCVVSEINTAEKMQNNSNCSDGTMIPIPLADGTQYGPITTTGGPYGNKIEWNQGAGTDYVNPFDEKLETACVPGGIESFAQPKSVNDEIENLRGIDHGLYTIFRPGCMKDGEKYPVITWANGTCGETHGYSVLLGTVASYGFVVVASNSTWTGRTFAQDGTTPVMLRALDYAKYLNEDKNSIFYGKLDMDKVGAMGHSQGAMATMTAASDPRIKSIILWNGGASNDKPFLDVSGEQDVGGTSTPQTMANSTNAATKPGAWIYYHQILNTGGQNTGHLVLMEQPERVVDMAVAWWQWQLNGDTKAKKMFVGDDCDLCDGGDAYEYGHNTLLE
jgi:hypothetical protein